MRPRLEAALRDTITHAARSRTEATDHEMRERLQQLVVSLEQALTDVAQGREAKVLGLISWVAGWIPNAADPLLAKLQHVEREAIESWQTANDIPARAKE